MVSVVENSFSFTLSIGDISKIAPHYRSVSTFLKGDNFYYTKFWQDDFGCSLINGKLENCTLTPPSELKVSLYIPQLIDSVYAFAYALHNIMETNHCLGKSNSSEIRNCVTGKVLLDALSKVVFMKDGHNITFDENGDRKTNYLVKQIQYTSGGSYIMETVGVYGPENNDLRLNTTKLNWSGQTDESPPDSVCSKPCHKGEYYVRGDIICCWKCIKCEINEITAQKGSVCTACPTFTWPDQDTLTECVAIEAEFVHAGDPFGLVLIFLAGLGAFSCFIVVIFLYKYRKRKLIKASGIPLSGLVLFGDIAAFLSVPLFVTKPSTETCYLNQFAFQASFCLSYAPLLCKANRVCRIFESGRKGAMRPKFISTKSQLIGVTILYFFQVGLCTVSYLSLLFVTANPYNLKGFDNVFNTFVNDKRENDVKIFTV